jgi:hypothetical protein
MEAGGPLGGEYFGVMSVAEIKEELGRMSAEERKEIVRAIAEIDDAATRPAVREVHPSDPDVAAAMDAVFTKHRELLHRLAQ